MSGRKMFFASRSCMVELTSSRKKPCEALEKSDIPKAWNKNSLNDILSDPQVLRSDDF